MYVNLVISYTVTHSFIHQTFLGPLGTAVGTVYTTNNTSLWNL